MKNVKLFAVLTVVFVLFLSSCSDEKATNPPEAETTGLTGGGPIQGDVLLSAIGAAMDNLNTAFAAAAAYPVLTQVKWFGSDGLTMNTALLSNATAAGFAAGVGFASPLLGENSSGDYTRVKAVVEAEIGREAYALAVVAYDAFMLAAKTLTEKPEGTITELKTALLSLASSYTGITDTICFDVNGDRETAPYDFWGIELASGFYSWVKLD